MATFKVDEAGHKSSYQIFAINIVTRARENSNIYSF